MGVGKHQDIVFLIDFGISQKYHDPSSHIHILMQECLAFVSTLVFAFMNSHLGLQLAHCNNIESLTYTLIFLQQGLLPWLTSDGQSLPQSAILTLKQSFLSASQVCTIPVELATIFQHAHNLTFTQKPNYDYLCTILSEVAAIDDIQQMTGSPVPDYPGPNSTPVLSIPHLMADIIGIPRCSPVCRMKGKAGMGRMARQVWVTLFLFLNSLTKLLKITSPRLIFDNTCNAYSTSLQCKITGSVSGLIRSCCWFHKHWVPRIFLFTSFLRLLVCMVYLPLHCVVAMYYCTTRLLLCRLVVLACYSLMELKLVIVSFSHMFAWFGINWLHQLTGLSQTAAGGLLTIVSLATGLIAKSWAKLSQAKPWQC